MEGKLEKFFSELNEEERIHLDHLRLITKQIKFIYDKMNFIDFANFFRLQDGKVYDFRDGNFNYTIRDISRIQAAYVRFKNEDNLNQ